jgi:hypothetical protein
MGYQVPKPSTRRASWRQSFHAALVVGGFAWLAATLVGLTTGYGLIWAMNQAATGTTGALFLWTTYRLLTGRDEGLFIFFTPVLAIVGQSRPHPPGALVIWGTQAIMGSVLAMVLLIWVRIKPESLEANTIELNPGDPEQTNPPLWDDDLDPKAARSS